MQKTAENDMDSREYMRNILGLHRSNIGVVSG